LATGRNDFVDDGLRHRGIAARRLGTAAEVVDDDTRTAPSQLDGLRAADAARGACHDDHVTVERNLLAHGSPLSRDRVRHWGTVRRVQHRRLRGAFR